MRWHRHCIGLPLVHGSHVHGTHVESLDQRTLSGRHTYKLQLHHRRHEESAKPFVMIGWEAHSLSACGRPIDTIFHDNRTIHMVAQQVVASSSCRASTTRTAVQRGSIPNISSYHHRHRTHRASKLSFVVAAALRLRSTPHGVDAENMAPLCVLAHSPCWLQCCECLRALSGPGHMAAHRKRRLRTAVTAVRPRRASFCSHTALSGCDSH